MLKPVAKTRVVSPVQKTMIVEKKAAGSVIQRTVSAETGVALTTPKAVSLVKPVIRARGFAKTFHAA